VTINLAYTAPINPAGASPVLTQAQVWAGLQRKVRRAFEFVPIIKTCNILSEENAPTTKQHTIVREVQFAPGQGPKAGGQPVKETCLHFPPCRVDFQQEDGSTISNVVSKGQDGELWMTYVFEWRHAEVQEGSAEAKELEEKHWKTAKIAVEGSIDTIRRLVKEGELQ